jgi:hypothetical protein
MVIAKENAGVSERSVLCDYQEAQTTQLQQKLK